MEYDHTSDLIQDYLKLLEISEDYNVKIEVGKAPNVKEFEAHAIILSARSNYFQKSFLKYWSKNQEETIIFKKPNISPLIFEILLKYIYTGVISLDNKVNLVDIIIVADEFELNNVVQQLEEHLLQNESDWQFPKDFITIICHQDQFPDLYKVALSLVCRNPETIFESKDYFLKMEETKLIQLLKCDDLELKEIKIWDYLIKWGIENTDSILNDDLTKWKPMDFMNLEKTLHNCIPYIRFFQMSPDDYKKIRTTHFINILPHGLDDEIIQYFLNSNPNPSFNVLPLRILAHPFDSKIINAKDAALIASWIDQKPEPYHFNDSPYEFKLIYRASREGFSVNNFHSNCDNKGSTVVIVKVRNSGEIIGGYNPLDWHCVKTAGNERNFLLSNNHDFYNEHKCEASNSFIFSLTNRIIPILSRVSSKEEAIIWSENKGPCFGLQDLCIMSGSSQSRSLNNVVGKSKQSSYEKKIINGETFEIEEYEVFQINLKRCNYSVSSYKSKILFILLLPFLVLFYTMFASIIWVACQFLLIIFAICFGIELLSDFYTQKSVFRNDAS